MIATASELDISLRLGLLVAGHLLLYYWTRYVVAPATTNWSRFFRALALAPLLLFLSTLFYAKKNEEFTTAAYCVTIFLWLVPSKLCAFCMNRGQLVKAYDSGSTSAFALGLLFPITVAFHEKRISKESEEQAKKRHAYKDVRFSVIRYEKEEYAKEAFFLSAYVISKVAFMVLLRYGRHYFEESGHLFLRDVCFGWYFYANTSGVEDLISLFALLTLNIKLEPNFDRPWLSQSIKELWSRRYNRVFGTCLRDIAYDPICEGCWVRGTKYFDRKKPTKLRKTNALLVTFLVSGIMHIFVAWFAYMSEVPFLIGMFFLINGLVIFLEDSFMHVLSTQKSFKKILQFVPSWLYRVYSMTTIFTLGHYFFLPECVKEGYADAAMDGGLAFLPGN